MYRRLRSIPSMISSRFVRSDNHFIRIWKAVMEAIAGTEKDYTSGKLSKAIFLLAIPMILEMIMESMFAVMDIFFVSKLSTETVATVGITESLMTIVYSLAVGLSVATTAMVSRSSAITTLRRSSSTSREILMKPEPAAARARPENPSHSRNCRQSMTLMKTLNIDIRAGSFVSLSA